MPPPGRGEVEVAHLVRAAVSAEISLTLLAFRREFAWTVKHRLRLPDWNCHFCAA